MSIKGLYWQIATGFWDIKDQDREWKIYPAEGFGQDLYIIACNQNNVDVDKALENCFEDVRYLGAATYDKDKKGVEKATSWHWLVKVFVKLNDWKVGGED